MTKSALILALGLLCLTPAAQAQPGGPGSPQPAMCLARIDDRGTVHIRHLSGSRTPAQEIVVKKRNDKGETVDVKVVFQRQTVEEQITTIHESGVQLFDTAGKPQEAKKLANLLKQERPVLVFQGKPQAKYLAGYKKELPVLALPPIMIGGAEPLPAPMPSDLPPPKK